MGCRNCWSTPESTGGNGGGSGSGANGQYNLASRVEIPETPGLMSRLIGLGGKQKK